MRGKINVYNKELSDAVTYKLEILRAPNASQNKKGLSLRETLVLPKKKSEIYRCHLQLRDTQVKELTL
jgi:hypothetical protein